MPTRVWIDEGCICCQACVQACPTVFAFPDDHAVVLAAARLDGATDRNDATRSPLRDDVDVEAVAEAAAGCPVDIIRLDRAAIPVAG